MECQAVRSAVCLAARELREGDVRGCALAVPEELDRHAGTGLGPDDDTAQLLGMLDVPLADPHDQVTRFESGAMGRSVGLDLHDQGGTVMAEPTGAVAATMADRPERDEQTEAMIARVIAENSGR